MPSESQLLPFDCKHSNCPCLALSPQLRVQGPVRPRSLANTEFRTERIRRLNIKGLKADDYVMINGLVWYTILCVSFNQIASGGGSNLLAPGELGTLTPENIEERIRGSKWVLVSEHAMVLTVWSMKACMLMLYASIT
jgi:hypothetical protein